LITFQMIGVKVQIARKKEKEVSFMQFLLLKHLNMLKDLLMMSENSGSQQEKIKFISPKQFLSIKIGLDHFSTSHSFHVSPRYFIYAKIIYSFLISY
jgi:hypothetical protein